MKTKIIIGAIIVAFITLCGILVFSGKQSPAITAGMLLDQEIALQREKQNLVAQEDELNSKIMSIRNKRNTIQYSGLNYMGSGLK